MSHSWRLGPVAFKSSLIHSNDRRRGQALAGHRPGIELGAERPWVSRDLERFLARNCNRPSVDRNESFMASGDRNESFTSSEDAVGEFGFPAADRLPVPRRGFANSTF